MSYREIKLLIKSGEFEALEKKGQNLDPFDNSLLEGLIEEIKGNISQAIEKYNYAKSFLNNNQLQQLKFDTYYSLALASIGETESALDILNNWKGKISELTEHLDNELIDVLGDYYNTIGIVNSILGNFAESINHYRQSITYRKMLDNGFEIATTYNNLAQDFEDQGKYQQALSYYMNSINILKNEDFIVPLGPTYANIGNLYRVFREYDKAKFYLNKARSIFQDLGQNISLAEVLFYLIQLSIEKGFPADAMEDLDMLDKIANESDLPLPRYFEKVSRAIILKRNSRIIDKAKALELLIESLDVKEHESRLYSIVLLHLCDLLLFELMLTQDANIIEELKQYLSDLNEMANSQKSMYLQIESLIIQSKLFIQLYDTPKANKLLQEAYVLAKQIEAHHLLNQIRHIKNDQMKLHKKWNEIGKSYNQLTIRDPNDLVTDIHINFSRLENLITSKRREQMFEDDEINKARLLNLTEFPENFPIVIFQVDETGIQVFMKDFEEFPEKLIENTSTHEFLMKIGIVFSVLSGQGDSYNTEMLDVPAGISKTFRVLVFPFRLSDEEASDDRLELGYSFICLFIPKIIHPYLPPSSTLQASFSTFLDTYKSINEVTHSRLLEMKSEAIDLIKTWIQKL